MVVETPVKQQWPFGDRVKRNLLRKDLTIAKKLSPRELELLGHLYYENTILEAAKLMGVKHQTLCEIRDSLFFKLKFIHINCGEISISEFFDN